MLPRNVSQSRCYSNLYYPVPVFPSAHVSHIPQSLCVPVPMYWGTKGLGEHRDWGISLGNIGTGNHLWGISRLGNKGAGEHRDWEVKGPGNTETRKHRAYLVGEEMDWGV